MMSSVNFAMRCFTSATACFESTEAQCLSAMPYRAAAEQGFQSVAATNDGMLRCLTVSVVRQLQQLVVPFVEGTSHIAGFQVK